MADPGWFPDPSKTHQLRYWDGREWTDHVYDAGGGTIYTEPVLIFVNAFDSWTMALTVTISDAQGKTLATGVQRDPEGPFPVPHVLVADAQGRPLLAYSRAWPHRNAPSSVWTAEGAEVGRVAPGSDGRLYDMWTPAGFQGGVKSGMVTHPVYYDAEGAEFARVTAVDVPWHWGPGNANDKYVTRVARPPQGTAATLFLVTALYASH